MCCAGDTACAVAALRGPITVCVRTAPQVLGSGHAFVTRRLSRRPKQAERTRSKRWVEGSRIQCCGVAPGCAPLHHSSRIHNSCSPTLASERAAIPYRLAAIHGLARIVSLNLMQARVLCGAYHSVIAAHQQQITLWRAVGIACDHMFVCACTTTLALSRHLAQSRSAVQTM